MLGQSHSDPAHDSPLVGVGAGVELAAISAEPEAQYERARTQRIGFGGWLAIGWLVLAILVAIFVPMFFKTSNFAISTSNGLGSVGFLQQLSHPFGSNQVGQDQTIELAQGLRYSLTIGFGTIILGLLIGGSLGLIAGYFRGKLDTFITMGFNVLLAIPSIVLALALIAVLATPTNTGAQVSVARKMTWVIVALGIVSVPVLGRITRANTLQWSQREFVMAARAQGATNLRVMIREVLPNVLPAMFSIALLGIAVAIIAEGGLAILGAGVPGSLGYQIAAAHDSMQTDPHLVFEPIVLIFFTVLSLNYVGDIVRARFDVREGVL
jgi:peptide/nickel transport system permease protein